MTAYERACAEPPDEAGLDVVASLVDAPLAPPASGRPLVLLVTTRRWLAAARLALELSEAGFVVRAVCPAGHVLEKVGFVQGTRRLSPFNRLGSLRAELETVAPDLIAPADDVAARLLHALHARACREGPSGERLRRMVERSLGGKGNYEHRYVRAGVAAVAETQRVAAPKTRAVATLAELDAALADIGLPAVLKTDGSSGGEGVAVVRTAAEAEAAWRRLARPAPLIWSLKRLIVDREVDRIADRRRPVVNLQAFVPGQPATAAAALWRGEVLACVCAEVIETLSASGPATVVQVVRHPQMRETVARMTRAMELSGLCGFDFMLDAAGQAHLLEINPRATPTAHLTDVDGRSPPRALCAALRGMPVPTDKGHAGERVALFPQELIRDPESVHFASARHDVPAQSPALERLGRSQARRRGKSTRSR